MTELIEEFLAHKRIAIVGATDKPEKWGYKILQRLLGLGYEVFPVHPTLAAIDGIPVFRSLRDIQPRPDAANIVTPPAVTEETLRMAKEIGLARVWMQPGAQSDAAIEYCKHNDIACIHHRCIMTETAKAAAN